jgi:hypothetical protein
MNRLDPESGKVEQIKANATKPDALSEAIISSLAIDRAAACGSAPMAAASAS